MNIEELKKLISNKDQTDLIYKISEIIAENTYLHKALIDKEKEMETLKELLK